MKSIKLPILTSLLLLSIISSLTAQMMQTDPKSFSNFYHVPDQVTHRLAKVTGFNEKEDFIYQYNGHNDLVRVETRQEGKLVSYDEYLYNNKQQCIEIATYSFRASYTEMVRSLRECFEYNDKGQLTNYIRWNNHNTAPEDTTLVKDQIISIQYTEEGLPSRAHVKFLDPQDFQMYDSFDITLEYNQKGQLYKRIANYPDNQGLFEQEEITFDPSGEYMAILSYTDEKQELIEWQYSRDDKGNISNLGRAGFIFEFEFVPGQSAAQTFYPRFNLGKLFLYGFRNYSYLSIPQLYNGSKEAVAKHVTGEGLFFYEENRPLSITPLAPATQCQLQSDATAWTITGASTIAILYDLQGACLQSITPAEGVASINKTNLPAGRYIIQSGSQTFKVTR